MWTNTASTSYLQQPSKNKDKAMQITATDRTPAISLTKDPLKFSISGESFPEDVSAFYGEVISAVNQLASSAKGKLEVEMAMVYINSSSINSNNSSTCCGG
jgi:hypothetical protein